MRPDPAGVVRIGRHRRPAPAARRIDGRNAWRRPCRLLLLFLLLGLLLHRLLGRRLLGLGLDRPQLVRLLARRRDHGLHLGRSLARLCGRHLGGRRLHHGDLWTRVGHLVGRLLLGDFRRPVLGRLFGDDLVELLLGRDLARRLARLLLLFYRLVLLRDLLGVHFLLRA